MQERHRKPTHSHTYALFLGGRFFCFVFDVFAGASLFLSFFSTRERVTPRPPHLPRRLLRCHVEAHPSSSANFSSLETACQSYNLEKGLRGQSTCQRAEPHFNSFLFFAIAPHTANTHPLFVVVLGSFVRECDRLRTGFCMQSGQRGDSRGHY